RSARLLVQTGLTFCECYRALRVVVFARDVIATHRRRSVRQRRRPMHACQRFANADAYAFVGLIVGEIPHMAYGHDNERGFGSILQASLLTLIRRTSPVLAHRLEATTKEGTSQT